VPYEFLDDGVTSDVTFHAWGRSLEELFTAAADATLNVMVRSLDSVQPLETRCVSVEADALDLLLMRFLDELVYRKDVEELLLRATEVHVDPGRNRVQAVLSGERIDPKRHELVADVKAVTLHDLRVERTETGWDAHVTLDV
jgi:SHS2 domain-containing protein